MGLFSKLYKKEYNIILFLITVIFGVIVSFYQYKLIESELNSHIKIQQQHLTHSYDLFLKELQKDITLESDNMLALPGVKKAFKNRDREELYALLHNFYKTTIHHIPQLKIVTFRLNDGSTFLRLHKPQMFGDKLNSKRKIILDTIESQRQQFGFEVGKLKMTYRVVTPIFLDKTFLGVVEFGVEPEYITEKIDHIFDIQQALLIKKEYEDVNIEQKKSIYKDGFALVRADKLFENRLQMIDLNAKESRVQFKKSEYFIDTSLNLNDNKGNIAAKLLIAFNLDFYNDKLSVLIQNNLIITMILFIVLLFGFNFFTLKVRRSHESILKKDKVLAMQSKNAAMGEMIENIAHQWRQPLSIISTSASGMKMQKEHGILQDEDMLNSCDSIMENATYLSQTIEDFRGFYQETKKQKVFNIKNKIEYASSLVISNYTHMDIQMVHKLEDSVTVGYESELIQVLMNLLNNAKDELEKLQGEKYIFINLENEDDYAIIKIRDNAGGMDESIISKIFDSHFTTKDDNKGTGIGLYMSQKILDESFGGTIEAFNVQFDYNDNSYKGAEFVIKIPIETHDNSESI